ncbi:hypothetical protein DL96DRAFT_1718073 [Flagelloscypha sp. PMI_526]|nr:hypothetical protein DL96DRAFT_1718073 [Flagelloscypha sp. PMI_526]
MAPFVSLPVELQYTIFQLVAIPATNSERLKLLHISKISYSSVIPVVYKFISLGDRNFYTILRCIRESSQLIWATVLPRLPNLIRLFLFIGQVGDESEAFRSIAELKNLRHFAWDKPYSGNDESKNFGPGAFPTITHLYRPGSFTHDALELCRIFPRLTRVVLEFPSAQFLSQLLDLPSMQVVLLMIPYFEMGDSTMVLPPPHPRLITYYWKFSEGKPAMHEFKDFRGESIWCWAECVIRRRKESGNQCNNLDGNLSIFSSNDAGLFETWYSGDSIHS